MVAKNETCLGGWGVQIINISDFRLVGQQEAEAVGALVKALLPGSILRQSKSAVFSPEHQAADQNQLIYQNHECFWNPGANY